MTHKKDFFAEIWDVGQKHKASFDDWFILIGRLQMTLARNMMEGPADYRIVMHVADAKKTRKK
jgi:hypothetical protein